MSHKKNDNLPYVIILIMAIVAVTALGALFFRSSPTDELEPYGDYLVEEEAPEQNSSPSVTPIRSKTTATQNTQGVPPTVSQDEVLEKGLLPNGQVPPTPGGANTRRIISVRPSSELINIPVTTDAQGNPTGDIPDPDDFPEYEPTATP